MENWQLSWTSERSISISVLNPTHIASHTNELGAWLQTQYPDLIRSVIPSSDSVLIEFNIEQHSLTELWSTALQGVEAFERMQNDSRMSQWSRSRRVEIPVCYDELLAPDLEQVAQILNCPIGNLIELHSSTEYVVEAMGFMPGFAYLSPLHHALRLPRKETPRLRVPAGSVGIAENMTAVYPNPSAGGWHLIGRTPTQLFNPENREPASLQVGDTARFVQISLDEFRSYSKKPLESE
jgi:inhibitor of KinA